MKKTVLIKEVPKGEFRYTKNTYLKVDQDEANRLISGEFAVEYDPKKGKEITNQEEIEFQEEFQEDQGDGKE